MKAAPAVALVASMLVAGAIGGLAGLNAFRWSRAIASGDIAGTYAEPVYPKMPIPSGTSAGASGKLGADHASLFFDARGYRAHARMYDATTDPWRRSAVTFPPILIFLTAHSTARLDFVQSSLINNLVQVVLFGAAFAYTLWRSPSSWPVRMVGGAAAAFLLFCTPVGTTWFERAQTDMYCASAMLLLLKGMRDDKPRDFLLAGLAASLKWSCLPFIALMAGPYVFLARGGRRRRLLLVGLSLAVPFAMLLWFGEHAVRYVTLVQESELVFKPDGVSLQLYVPRLTSKILPFALPLAFLVLAWRAHRPPRTAGGFAEVMLLGAAGMACASFGTIAYEYRFVTLLFLLPLLVDGRSVLLGSLGRPWSAASRLAGVGVLVYAFRVETIRAADVWMGVHRGLVPLAIGVSALLLAAFVELSPTPPAPVRDP